MGNIRRLTQWPQKEFNADVSCQKTWSLFWTVEEKPRPRQLVESISFRRIRWSKLVKRYVGL